MHPPDSLVFDLDGTLWDSCEACAQGWNNVLRRHGMVFREIVADDVRRVAGKPHDVCMRETFVGFSERDLQILTEETAEEDNLIVARDGGVLFDGVAAGLRALAQQYPLFIVSNCQAGYIDQFMKHSGLGALFVDVECWGVTGRTKAENLGLIIERNRLAQPWFVGDTAGDHAAARACGVPFVHARYGFGDCPDADLRIARFGDLPHALGIAI